MKDISDMDELIMKLLHYFITKEDYSPIVLHGAKNEIWLQNLDGDYKIVRIVSNYIHNNDQLDFDLFKTREISKQIKKKTVTFSLNILSIYTNLGENVKLEEFDYDNMKCLKINNMKDFNNYKDILDIYPKIDLEPATEKGMELFIKLTSDISEKTEKDAMESEKIFKMKTPIVTYTLIAINVIVFILMYVIGNGSTDTNTLINFGANYAPYVKDGEYYRLFTSIFLHIGILHLLCNMYALYVIGPQLESFFGKIKYIIIYLGGGIIGNLLANVLEANSVGAGASGAIFALLGALLYFGYHYRVYLGTVIKSQIIPLIVLNLFIGFTTTGISNAAHIGGLLGGAIIAMALGVPNKSTTFEKVNGWIITLIAVIFLTYMSIFR